MTLLLPSGLDTVLGISLEVLSAGFGEQMNLSQTAPERPPAVVEIPKAGRYVGSGDGSALVREVSAIISVVTYPQQEVMS